MCWNVVMIKPEMNSYVYTNGQQMETKFTCKNVSMAMECVFATVANVNFMRSISNNKKETHRNKHSEISASCGH